MHNVLTRLINLLDLRLSLMDSVIDWGSPVLSFGDLSTAEVATVGLNPSNREFVDGFGAELGNDHRRFHTLRSLGLREWGDVDAGHLRLMLDSYRAYFSVNPYESWFRKLDQILSATKSSFFNSRPAACHLDLIPYATKKKWSELSAHQRASLLAMSGDTLALLVRRSPIRVLILNGKSVVLNFEKLAGKRLSSATMSRWSLPRQNSSGVDGIAYKGIINELSGIDLARPVLVLGYNHNVQSSFGVTTEVVTGIRDWVADEVSAYK